MYKPSLEKRFKGLHYEIGRVPEAMAESKLWWALPHDVRRALYFAAFPGSAKLVRDLRSRDPESKDKATLKPFLETKSIFIHIPKAAGISISYGLYGRKTGDHRTLSDYKLCFSKAEFDSMFKFAFVRNPWDRLLSAYSYLSQGGRNAQDAEWASMHLSKYADFNDFVLRWVNDDNVRSALHFKPQVLFVCDANMNIETDLLGRFENIKEDYEQVRSRVESSGELYDRNRTSVKSKDYRKYYTDQSAYVVENVYGDDIRILGYKFDV